MDGLSCHVLQRSAEADRPDHGKALSFEGFDMSPVMTVAEAAAFLKVSDDVLYPMLARGEIPAGKVKGQWRLIEDDLLNWLRSQYSVRARAPSDVEVLCHTEGKEPVTGGSLSKEYASLLGLPNSRTQKHSKGS